MNKQITEDYVSFEIAKLLKEKGFDIPCRQAYFNGSLVDYTMYGFCDGELLDCPSQSLALKWLREVHEFIVTIDYDRYPVYNGENNIVGYGYNIQTKDNPEDYYRISESVFDSYEQAVEAALKYTLENLI